MKPDRNSNMPLYMQLKDIIAGQIKSGKLKPGSVMPTESDLCRQYGISRFPVRQAMDALVAEGYIHRTRGKGTFINTELPKHLSIGKAKVIGLILGNLTAGFTGQILSGFEKQARKRGYLTISCCSEESADEEISCIDRIIEAGANGIFIFPCDESRLETRVEQLKANGVYLGIMDRNPGFDDVDYVGSDNWGGAYSAVRHMAQQGFVNTVFVSCMSDVSSIKERLEGYLKAVEDFAMNPVTNININESYERPKQFYRRIHRHFIEGLRQELAQLTKYLPLGVFAVNDHIALQCMSIFQEEGLVIGKDIGLVGFDNNVEAEYAPVPLTTIAQNGILLGRNAADIAIDKIEGRTSQVYRSIVPTQLVVRSSCGEKMADSGDTTVEG